ncbi:hypothetical protein NSK_008738 [Nannochloropsis salina CCMP1776]|uniref:Uncharacterized protein n=1 Tax=Nannochloropsis salina CCMP1776 TaxID=1027361 RepID=A0A4D9CLF5_9STRA|nr:hypothetical protein NSK_008738 [Nannochloropsis salina CCMP1776]|eukprot:TFJ79931.1 hypothetical protein NSK_008738 [Nannochloropsis salina CCMP1776]
MAMPPSLTSTASPSDIADGLMADLFPRHVRQIFPGSKRAHFQRLHEITGIPYREMAFWDDWDLNCRDVSRLGVYCCHVPSGLTLSRWEKALEGFARRKEEEGW